ncbi:MAG: DNA-directed RNA polymerase subunit beta, partial [Acidobacteria bacterium]
MSANLLETLNPGLGRRTSQAPQRQDFSKIKTSVPIPNLIEIQRESYNRFLQMDALPEERGRIGLQTVFQSVFPISDFRETATLDFVEYHIGNWQCKCGNLEGLKYLRTACKNCGASIKVDPLRPGETLCHVCGAFNSVRPELCPNCGEPVGLKHKHDQQECQERGMSYSVPLKVKIRLTVYDKDPDTNVKSIRDIKEEEVFFGEIPLMTDNGTFIINGTERVIVSQLHRSPGVFFKRGQMFIAKIIPYRGSWVEFEYDQKNLLYVRVGKRKFLASIFLRALGIWLKSNFNSKSFGSDGQLEEAVKSASFTDEDLVRAFYVVDEVRVENGRLMVQIPDTGPTNLIGMKVDFEIKGRGPDPIVRKGKEISRTSLEGLRKAKIGEVEIEPLQFEAAYAASDVVNTETGEVLLEANTEITTAKLQEIAESGIQGFGIFFPERDDVGVVISQTLKKDAISKPVDALLEIYRKMRPGDPPTVQTAYRLLEGMFFDPRKFDFSRVGRLKFNIKMGKPEMGRIDDPLLAAKDFFEVVSYVLKMRKNPVDEEKRPIYQADDIDHLGNRRVRAVGELLENQFRIGLERMERAIKEKMSIHQEMQTTMPRDLINAKPVTAAVREFFGSSQLSQFMDQTNPLSEITHKRRLSALGPGGLSRERAGFEVRDVHPTHYGRICPIETPEGPNIGLISSLSCYARINEFGFIESPYRKVVDGRVVEYVRVINGGETKFKPGQHVPQDDVDKANKRIGANGEKASYDPHPFYLTAWEEDKHVVGQANIELDDNGYIVNERNAARKAGEFILAERDEIEYVDVSPKQLVSVAASLIPFLENDDANR